MKSLITLETTQLNKIIDFSVIGNLTQLEGLGLNGSIWTAQKLDNIEFISSLQQLRYLTLTSTQIKQKSFDPLLKLQQLERFDCSWNYPEKEFEKLKNIRTLKYGNVETTWKQIKEDINNRLGK
ncbi:MAG: hypothetical protein JHD28_03585 [Bacteroidia bacterium]|nr:hypothetical protein [Bacteroidia bacterium]